MKRFFQLYDVANDYSLSPVPGKYQFGDLAHAKKQAQIIIDKWVAGMDTRAGPLSAYKIKWNRGAASGIRPEAKMEWNGFIHDGELTYKIIEREKNPTKRKKAMARKKKRSAKQLANDRRLGRMAKARAKAKRGGRSRVTRKVTRKKTAKRRTVRRANPKRKVSARSHLWTVFRCRGKSVYYLALKGFKLGWTLTRGHAISFKLKDEAARTARKMSKKRGWSTWQFGVANELQSTAQIAAACKAGK